MTIDSKRVRGRLKYVKVICDHCSAMYPRSSFSSINKACQRASKNGWDTSRYFPGCIYCRDCVLKHGIKPYEDYSRPSDPLSLAAQTNGTEPSNVVQPAVMDEGTNG